MKKNGNSHFSSNNSVRFLSLKGSILFIAISLTSLIIVLAPLVFHGVKAANYALVSYQQVKNLVSDSQAKNWSAGVKTAANLQVNLKKLDLEISRLGLITKLPKLNQALKISRQFLAVADSLTGSYLETFKIFAKVEELGAVIDPLDLLENKEALKLISANNAGLTLAQNNVDQAKKRFAEINTNEFSGLFSKYLFLAHAQLGQILTITDLAIPALPELVDFLGFNGAKHYLLIFENNMELRPTGGFIGSYGIITIESGEVKKIFTDDVYNLDKLSAGKMKELAPLPMQKYNNQKYWYLRDANWSANWPDSAKKITEFFHKERINANLSDQPLDGVIAITPDFIANLLAVIGPIKSQGLTFSAKNFALDLEKFVEFDFSQYDVAYSERKEIIGDLADILIARMENIPTGDLVKLWLAVKKNIDQKQILVYMFDDKLQKYFSDRQWSGEVKATAGDYLMIVDSNLASLKTDSVMERSIKQTLKINNAGDLIAQLEITYQHNGQFLTDLITRYRTYAKVYVPEGSWFERGWIKAGDKETALDMSKDLEYGNEFGKSYAAYFLVIEPGHSKTIILEYKLPATLKNQSEKGQYSLTVQKQPGTSGHKLEIDLNFSRDIAAYKSDNFPSRFDGQSISWKTDLSVDREYIIKF